MAGRPWYRIMRAGETIGPGLISKILRDCQMSRDEVAALL
jgi:hypothetical protein